MQQKAQGQVERSMAAKGFRKSLEAEEGEHRRGGSRRERERKGDWLYGDRRRPCRCRSGMVTARARDRRAEMQGGPRLGMQR